MQFFEVDGEMTEPSMKVCPALPAAKTGRKSMCWYAKLSTCCADRSYAALSLPQESE